MCGIIAYLGTGDSLSIIETGLQNLEYRGYDSAGIALASAGGLEVYKQSGRIGDLTLPSTAEATCGIGHTRWSTHGEPTDENAHPHTDCEGNIAVVHNGIISNYRELKADLEGHIFTSETDTEVVPHLIEEERRTGHDLRTAVARVVDRLEGSFAIAVTEAGSDELVGARQDSPLVVGHGEDGAFLASDVTAFAEHTRRVTYLADGDVVHITPDGVTIFNDGQRVERDIDTVDWEPEAAEKGGYEHYMLKEIHEQPRALRQALSGRVDALSGAVDLDVDLSRGFLRNLSEIQIVACGTSYHAGLYAKRLFEAYADIRVTVEIASEYAFDGGSDPRDTLVVAVTQSGETADTLSAIRRAVAAGARTLSVTNTVGSTVTRDVDETVYIRAGPEIGVAATKTFASQVATLALIAVHFGRVRGTLTSDAAGDVLSSLRRLPGAVQSVLDTDATIREIAEAHAAGEAFFFIGRGLGYPVALESALKLKEISYDHAEGFAAGELKHGPLALVTPETPVIALLTDGTRPSETLNNVKEVASRGAPVIGVSTIDDAETFCDDVIDLPSAGQMEPLVATVALQLFAYHIANLKGRPIDKPRNLAKSVTVE